MKTEMEERESPEIRVREMEETEKSDIRHQRDVPGSRWRGDSDQTLYRILAGK